MPDFFASTASGYTFVTEVTEFEPESPLHPCEFRVCSMTPGDSVRTKLCEKRGQVRQFADKCPTMIVVAGGFDHFGELDPAAFDAALYGAFAIRVFRLPAH